MTAPAAAPGATPRLIDGAIVRPLPDGDAVVASADGATAVILNGTAQVLIGLLDGQRTADDLVAVVLSCWPTLTHAEVRRDVDALLAELAAAGLLS